MPLRCAGPNRLASLAAVRLDATGAPVSNPLPASTRTRSSPARQSCPASCAVAIPTSSAPPLRPRSRAVIEPMPRSRTSTIPNLVMSSSTAASPAHPVSVVSGDGAGDGTHSTGRTKARG